MRWFEREKKREGAYFKQREIFWHFRLLLLVVVVVPVVVVPVVVVPVVVVPVVVVLQRAVPPAPAARDPLDRSVRSASMVQTPRSFEQ